MLSASVGPTLYSVHIYRYWTVHQHYKLHTQHVSAEEHSETGETIFFFKAAAHTSKHLAGGRVGQNKSPSRLPRPAHTRVPAAGALGTLWQVKPDDLFSDAAHK